MKIYYEKYTMKKWYKYNMCNNTILYYTYYITIHVNND